MPSHSHWWRRSPPGWRARCGWTTTPASPGLAESVWGSGQDLQSFVYLRLMDGVGGALITHGTIYDGLHGSAGEFGHMTVDPSGPECRCGKHGCLEAYVSREQVLAATAHRDLDSLREVLDAGDERRQEIVAGAGRRIGMVLANVCTSMDVEGVVLGGDLMGLGHHLTGPIEKAFAANLMPARAHGISLRTGRIRQVDGASRSDRPPAPRSHHRLDRSGLLSPPPARPEGTHQLVNSPNMFFFMTDQHRVDTLPCYGNEVVQTPWLDSLAAQGTVFDQVLRAHRDLHTRRARACSRVRRRSATSCWPTTSATSDTRKTSSSIIERSAGICASAATTSASPGSGMSG